MKRHKWIIPIVLLLILLVRYKLFNVDRDVKPVSKTTYLMGTIINLTIYDDVDDEVFEESFNIIRAIESKMSLNIEDSELNNINKEAFNKRLPLSDEMKYILEKSIDYSKLSEGYFDVTVGPLVTLWGIGSENAKVPMQDEIEMSIANIDYESINISNEGVLLDEPDMIIDLGAIAKGYAADCVAEYLRSQNVERAIVDLGGNIYALGSKSKDTPWNVAIQNPFHEARGNFIGSVSVSDKSVVTSGVYERFLESDGVKYHHILNPFTGYPIENELMSVSIISEMSIDGDALSTSVFSLGLDKGYELIESLEDVSAIFVTNDKSIYLTPGASDIFDIKDTSFKIEDYKKR